nr:DUF4350 domain-containing protein [Candidatus Prometheoarchaeum syntrophicum]QEE16212.1 hypothetical protein DSAG12_02042 [Candidatus Prometheoarchaeum syntrophicum]
MAVRNYGIIVTPIGLLFIIIGGILGGIGGNNDNDILLTIGIFTAILGVITLFIGISRLVQGKDRKIMGQIVRPKAAARGSAIWAALFFNITPLLLNNPGVMEHGPPFPLAIVFNSDIDLQSNNYLWVPFVVILFTLLWIVGFLFSGKFPKTVNIFFNWIITICLTFYVNFGLYFFLSTFYADKTGNFLLEPWADATTIAELTAPLIISISILIISIFFLTRMIKNLKISFSNLNVKKKNALIVNIILITAYISAISPIVFGIWLCLTTTTPYMVSPYIAYFGFIFVGIVIYYAISTLISTFKDLGKSQAGEGKAAHTGFSLSGAIFIALLFLTWSPLFLPIVDQGMNNKNNSIYNPDWNGWSNFAEAVRDEGYDVMSIQSSISTVDQLDPNKQIILVIGGPNVFYNPLSEIPYFLTAFRRNFSMFVNEDHGQAGNLLFSTYAASLLTSPTPLTLFAQGVLNDNASYWKDPTFPIIKNFPDAGILTQNVNEVCLSSSGGFLGGTLFGQLGWNFLGSTSSQYSWIDRDNNGIYNANGDTYNLPDTFTSVLQDQESMVSVLGNILEVGLQLGGYSQTVFGMKELALNEPITVGNTTGIHSSRMFVSADASWLNNELTSDESREIRVDGSPQTISGFDNLQFGLNIIEYLACGRDTDECIVVFDEAHIRPEIGYTEISSASSFGATQGYVNWLSTNPILGLVYPLFALQTLRKWIPKEGDKKKVQLRDLEEEERRLSMLSFRSSSFFAQKINWYRQHHKFRQALIQLYRRLERKVNRLLGDAPDRSVTAIMKAIERERGKYMSKDNYRRIQAFFEKMVSLKANKSDIKNEHEFEDLFMEMSWVSDHV